MVAWILPAELLEGGFRIIEAREHRGVERICASDVRLLPPAGCARGNQCILWLSRGTPVPDYRLRAGSGPEAYKFVRSCRLAQPLVHECEGAVVQRILRIEPRARPRKCRAREVAELADV